MSNDSTKLRVLDLFSGIGGFSLGLERTGGFETIAFCEIEPYARAVLAKHWPTITIHGDVRELQVLPSQIDIITGGFPCQDISLAGKGAGLSGERSGLWSEFHRLIKEAAPRYAVIENVSALRSRGLGEILRSLAAIGYDAEWHCIPASAVGLPHRRDRVWIIAYPRQERGQGFVMEEVPGLASLSRGENERRLTDWTDRPDLHGPRLCSRRHGLSEELGCYGNAIVPQIAEIIGTAILRKEGLVE